MTNEHFMLMSGKEAPLGAFVRDKGCNFSVWAPEATRVTLILYTDDEQESSVLIFLKSMTAYGMALLLMLSPVSFMRTV